ncbi:MAG: hypothetical protein HOQ29_13125 [Acidobacteria bacterium]|nr:hypothetical protein [Acidobacteriota bacterium]
MRGRSVCAIAVVVVLAATSARADPIVLRPAASIEIVDPAPLDGAGLRLEVSENVALGPGAETRVFYEFAIPALRATRSPIVFSVFRRLDEFSECASLVPCPDLTRLDLFGYAGAGAITAAAYNAGVLLASIAALPGRGHTIRVDVTGFVNGLLAEHGGFAGFALRPGSIGALGASEARLSATPEPGSRTLLAIGALGALARRGRNGDTHS